jgi:two-component system sensor histidine kinase CpxA
MTRLYWKIFLSFWVVIILTVVITVTVNSIVFRDEADNTRFNALRGSLAGLSERAQRTLDEGGKQGLRDWLRERQDRQPFPPLLIIDSAGKDLLGRPLPPRFDPQRLESSLKRARRPGPGRKPRLQIHELRGANGETYRLLVPNFRPRLGGWFMQPQARAMFPLILVLLSGAACLLLARYLTRPIRAFRIAGKAIAGGDLSTRVGPEIARRRDEFGDLAIDFDRMAEQIEALLGSQKKLLRDVSHELRSPLARLQAAAGLIRQKDRDADNAHLDRIEREAENLNELIGQILNFVRLESLTSIDRQPVDLGRLVGDIVDDARYEGEAEQKTVDYHLTEDVEISADEALIYRAIENVVRNAIRHSRHRTGVTISESEPGHVKITVDDDGPGIDPADAERIFEPFFTRPSPDGTAGAGIGLAIARRAAELHGGSIRARNRPQGGLSVEIEIS